MATAEKELEKYKKIKCEAEEKLKEHRRIKYIEKKQKEKDIKENWKLGIAHKFVIQSANGTALLCNETFINIKLAGNVIKPSIWWSKKDAEKFVENSNLSNKNVIIIQLNEKGEI